MTYIKNVKTEKLIRIFNKSCIVFLLINSIFFLLSTQVAAKNNESYYVNSFCGGKVEFTLLDKTRVDCLTEIHAIEYDFGKKWAEAIGQSLYYAAMTGKKAGIVLIVSPSNKARYLKRLMTVINSNNLQIDIWTIQTNNMNIKQDFIEKYIPPLK